jgi:hypothetical protein
MKLVISRKASYVTICSRGMVTIVIER